MIIAHNFKVEIFERSVVIQSSYKKKNLWKKDGDGNTSESEKFIHTHF